MNPIEGRLPTPAEMRLIEREVFAVDAHFDFLSLELKRAHDRAEDGKAWPAELGDELFGALWRLVTDVREDIAFLTSSVDALEADVLEVHRDRQARGV